MGPAGLCSLRRAVPAIGEQKSTAARRQLTLILKSNYRDACKGMSDQSAFPWKSAPVSLTDSTKNWILIPSLYYQSRLLDRKYSILMYNTDIFILGGPLMKRIYFTIAGTNH